MKFQNINSPKNMKFINDLFNKNKLVNIKMKVIRSGQYICKIVYNIANEKYAEPLDDLLSRQPYVKCKIHTRIRKRIWFHEVKDCEDNILEEHNLTQPSTDENDPPDDDYDHLCGFIYSYDEKKDLYICNKQVLKNTGGIVWDLYIKLYSMICV